MAWINNVSLHAQNTRFVREISAADAAHDSFFILDGLAQSALALGDKNVLQKTIAMARPIYERLLKTQITPKLFDSLAIVGAFLKRSCFFHIAGEDQSAVWRKVLSLGEPNDALVRGLLSVFKTLGEKETDNAKKSMTRYPRNASAFVKGLSTHSVAESLDIANSPDHSGFSSWMQYFYLPLAVKRARQLECDPILPLCAGARPERRGDPLYKRSETRPAFGTRVDSTDPKTWFGFDAIERKGDALFVYHYVGITWKAPLAFDGNLNAFSFLESLPHDWKQVEDTVLPDVWSTITEMRTAGNCAHVVCYDPTEASAIDGATKKAGEHYGVRLVTKSLFDV